MNLRGLVTSLGAGGSLIAAALCALVLVGGLLAVGRVTDGSARAESGDVVVPGAGPTEESADEPLVVSAAADRAAATAAADRPRSTARWRTIARPRGGALPQRPVSRPSPSAPPATSSPAPEAGSPGPSPSSPPPASEPAANEAGTVRRAV